MQYFYYSKGSWVGPISSDVVVILLKNGTITISTPIRNSEGYRCLPEAFDTVVNRPPVLPSEERPVENLPAAFNDIARDALDTEPETIRRLKQKAKRPNFGMAFLNLMNLCVFGVLIWFVFFSGKFERLLEIVRGHDHPVKPYIQDQVVKPATDAPEVKTRQIIIRQPPQPSNRDEFVDTEQAPLRTQAADRPLRRTIAPPVVLTNELAEHEKIEQVEEIVRTEDSRVIREYKKDAQKLFLQLIYFKSSQEFHQFGFNSYPFDEMKIINGVVAMKTPLLSLLMAYNPACPKRKSRCFV